jgi:predicted transcriptional regulator
MSDLVRLPNLVLGELEQSVLDILWQEGALNPVEVHSLIGVPRGISVNTVSSALKRLHEKELLHREKISHAYVYRAAISRAELQRLLIEAIAGRFAGEGRLGLLAAFVDFAGADGDGTLRKLEDMIAARLAETDE